MVVYDNIERMWFGTEQKMRWIETPQTGADVSSTGQTASSVLLNGGGVVRNSWDSHKVYQFSWGTTASPDLVSLLQAYRNGSYGRGLIYFHDPMYYGSNLLPKRWADPSMAVNYEAEPLVPDVWPTAVPVLATDNNYPVNSAQYTLPANYSSQANSSEHFIPIPPGMTLLVGAAYSGVGQVYVRTSAGKTVLVPMTLDEQNVVNLVVSGQPWARIGIQNPSASPASIALTGMTARLSEYNVPGGETTTNAFTNPSFEAAGPTIEYRRNLTSNPLTGASTNMLSVTRGAVAAVSGGVQFTVSDATAADAAQRFGQVSGNAIPVTPGQVISVSLDVGVSSRAGQSFLAQTFFQDASNVLVGSVVRSESVTPAAGAYSRVFIENLTVPAGAAKISWEVGIGGTGPRAINDTFRARNLLVERSPRVLPFFYGGGTSPDSDMTVAWAGTANESESVMNAVSIPGITAVRGFLVRSQRWAKAGTYSMRLIPDYRTLDQGNVAAVISGMPTNATHIVTSYTLAPLTGSGAAQAGMVLRNQNPPPGAYSQRPNVAGEFEHRFTAQEATGNIELWGSRYGGGDIWFDMLAVVPGEYSGPAFSGNTPGARWDGAPNASTSTYVRPLQTILATGPWMSGEGHGGCRFVGNPTVINYNGVGGGQIGLSAVFQEVGPWE